MTNRDRINLLLLKNDDKLIDFLLESPCEHCYYCGDSCCIDSEADDMDICVDGIKKWLESEE